MDGNRRLAARWLLVAGYLGLVTIFVACAPTPDPGGVMTPTPAATQVTPEAVLRLEQGAVELRTENGDWMPVAGETTFEITGELQGTDPWMLNGNTFAARDSTQVDEGLELGAQVRARGVILEDGTWLAYAIQPAETEVHLAPLIVLTSKVASIDPWVINGITLNVTSDTLIGEGIEPEMIVRVEMLLLEDGAWEVLSVVPLGNFTDVPGCATVAASVDSMEGAELQLAGWPAITLDDEVKIENDGGGDVTLRGNESVLAVVCPSEEGQIRITHIIILSGEEGEKVLICHKPDQGGGHTLRIAASAESAYLRHGDLRGACP